MPTQINRPDERSPFHLPRPQTRSRVILLGSVAALALAGTAGNLGAAGLFSSANAAPVAVNANMQPAGPASFADLVDRVKGSVVSVKVRMAQTVADTSDGDGEDSAPQSGPQLRPGDPLERFFKQFGGKGFNFRNGKPQSGGGQALGSGFLISADGYVVTNNHVVQNATEVEIGLDNGRTVPATIVGTDKKTDLALLKIKDKGDYPFVEFASHTPRVGDWVIAVGNPFGLGGTVTAGIVSARGRDIGAGPYDDFLQIDAPVNRGNSGGPAFDATGQVVGVNTAIFSPSGGSVGIGFAIPAEVAKTVVAALKDKGTVSRGWLGVQVQPVTQDIADSLGQKSTKGALVSAVQSDSPAAAAGIKSGDVITSVEGEAIDAPRDLSRRIASAGPDKKVDVGYTRGGSAKNVSMQLRALPADKEARAEMPGQTEQASLGNLGVQLAPAASIPGAGKDGVVVANIDPDGAAAQKGLRSGDVILEAAGQSVSRPSEISAALDAARKDGRKALLLRVKSGDSTRFVAIATNPAG